MNTSQKITPEEVRDQTVLLQLTLRRFGNTRKGDLKEITTSADKEMLALGKRLFMCKEYKAIVQHDADTLKGIRQRSIPSLFKAGIYQISPRWAPKIRDFLMYREQVRKQMVSDLLLVYDTSIEEAAARLGPQFDRDDYPPGDEFAEHFEMEYQFFSIGSPDAVSGLDPVFVKEEAARISDMFERAREEGLRIVREQFSLLVEHLIDRLTPAPGGEKKRFHATAVTNLTDFLDTFDMKNVANDTDIQRFVDEAKKLLSGVSPKAVRNSEVQRDRLADGFASLKKTMDAALAKGTTRFVDVDAFDETEAG